MKGAGQGGLALAIDGPDQTQINCKDNRDGTCEVEYTPVKPGDYDVTIKFADQHIPGRLLTNFNRLDMYEFLPSRLVNPFEPRHEIFNNVVCATSKAPDQPAHMRSLMRAFASGLNIL